MRVDVVDGLRWLQEDIRPELIIIDDIRSVVRAVTNNHEPVETSLRNGYRGDMVQRCLKFALVNSSFSSVSFCLVSAL